MIKKCVFLFLSSEWLRLLFMRLVMEFFVVKFPRRFFIKFFPAIRSKPTNCFCVCESVQNFSISFAALYRQMNGPGWISDWVDDDV